MSRRRFLLPMTHRAILRCRTRSSRRIPRYQRGFSFFSPVLKVASLMSPRSMPIDSPVFGSGSGFSTSQENATNHLPARQNTRAVLIVPSSLRCQRTAMRPMPVSLSRRPVDLEPVAVLLEAEPRESVPSPEPRIARLLPGLDPAKERLERLVQIGRDVLKDVAVNVQSVGTRGFLDLDLAKLHGLADRLASFLVSLFPLATAVVVEVAARLAHGFQSAALALAGIQAVEVTFAS